MPEKKRIKANVRTKTEAEVEVPASAEVTKLVISHRLVDGKFVYDLFGPDGTTITHRPKVLTGPIENA